MTQSTGDDAVVLEIIRDVVGNASAGTVFGTPISQNGLMVLPVAKVSGGGGGGGGSGPAEAGTEPHGAGGGLGVSAKPLGVFVVKEGRVAWRPAVDVTKVIIGAQVVALAALVVFRGYLRARSRR
jgi:uncharacterized spore protein YtfJ